jgi:RimJ/RimL family protein N-acetyltransferase
LLTWREATSADRDALMRFGCTEPPRHERYLHVRKVYPKPWERDVEAYVRAFRPPGPPDQTFLIGLDEEGIGAVCAFVKDPPPEWLIKLQVVGVARRYRGQGGAVANEAMTVAIQAAFDAVASAGHQQVRIIGLVHVKNLASQRMCQRNGLVCDGPAPEADGYDQWSAVVTFDTACTTASP